MKEFQKNHPYSKWDGVKFTSTGLPLRRLTLPNVDMFATLTEKYDEIIQVLGLERVLKRIIFSTTHDFSPANAYLIKMWTKLHRYAERGEKEKFEKLMRIMEKHSKSLRLLSIHRLDARWYKDWSAKKLRKVWRRATALALNNSTKYRVKRVMIPKEGGGQRPLSVPSLPWRIHVGSKYIFTWIWWVGRGLRETSGGGYARPRTPHYPRSLHGGLPHRGTGTAWADLINRGLKAKNILETDLTKFFDRVTFLGVQGALNRQDYPGSLKRWIMRLLMEARAVNQSKGERLMEQTKGLEKSGLNWNMVTNTKLGALAGMISQTQQRNKEKTEAKAFLEREAARKEEKAKAHQPISVQTQPVLGKGKASEAMKIADNAALVGLPQGMNLSPLLSAMALSLVAEGRTYAPNLVGYVDDLVFFGDDDLDDKVMNFMRDIDRNLGVELSMPKTKWVKKDGEWIAPLKFLGLTYDPWGDRFFASTRKGATVEMPKADVAKARAKWPGHYQSQYRKDIENLSTHELGLKYGFWDTLVNYLYTDGKPKGDAPEGGWPLDAKKSSMCQIAALEMAKQTNIPLSLFNASTWAVRAMKYRVQKWSKIPKRAGKK